MITEFFDLQDGTKMMPQIQNIELQYVETVKKQVLRSAMTAMLGMETVAMPLVSLRLTGCVTEGLPLLLAFERSDFLGITKTQQLNRPVALLSVETQFKPALKHVTMEIHLVAMAEHLTVELLNLDGSAFQLITPLPMCVLNEQLAITEIA